jgi:hypothetical protein
MGEGGNAPPDTVISMTGLIVGVSVITVGVSVITVGVSVGASDVGL